MDCPVNPAQPQTLHIDLNSCFAMVEQQANPLLRGRPVGVAANMSPGGCVISPSYEAKARGVTIGRVRDAQAICPEIIIIPSDPDKYFHVHQQFVKIFRDYSPDVTAISIDEAVISLSGTAKILGKGPLEVAREIKRRLRDEVGDWITCNIGIATNRFLAKLAASLHKPDGLDIISHQNLEQIYDQVELLDLCGINTRYRRRLRAYGIMTPRQFFSAPLIKLQKQVFRSIVGYHWYFRLRGWEVDNLSFGRRSYGQSYALHRFTNDTHELGRLMLKLCEKMGRRLRRSGNYARGVHVFCGYRQHGSFHQGQKFPGPLYATPELYDRAMQLLSHRPREGRVTHLAVSCFELAPLNSLPLPLFETSQSRDMRLADALDQINTRYGEYVIAPASMMGLDSEIIKRVPFHATGDSLAEIYREQPAET